jgi:hypothetical protein
MIGQSMVNDGPTIGYWVALLEHCEKEVHERATASRRRCGRAALRLRCVKKRAGRSACATGARWGLMDGECIV